MTIDTQRLRDLASKATPGPWKFDGYDVFQLTDSSGQGYPLDRYPDSADIITPQCEECGHRIPLRDENAAFIAAANPQTVLEMCEEVETLRADLKIERGGIDWKTLAIQEEREKINWKRILEATRKELGNACQQLAAVTAARDEACSRWLDLLPVADISNEQRAAECAQIATLRTIGSPK